MKKLEVEKFPAHTQKYSFFDQRNNDMIPPKLIDELRRQQFICKVGYKCIFITTYLM